MHTRIAFIAALIFLGLAVSATPVLADVIPLSSLSLVGTSQIISGGTLRLTPNYDTDPSGAAPAGAAWTNSEYNVAAPFSVNFKFQMSSPCLNSLTDTPPCVNDNGNGGDGIAFLIQNSSAGKTAIGEGAGGMGFLGITDSVAVMLDTYQNNSPNYYGDPSGNYISVNTRGTDFNVPHHFCTNGQLTDITSGPMAGQSDLTGSSLSPDCTGSPTLGMQTIDPSVDNMDVGVHDVQITYTGSMLDIYLDSTLYLSVALDLATTLNLEGGNDAFLGFTAGTRFAYQNQDILSFSESPIPEPMWGQLWFPLGMLLAIALGRKFNRSRP